EDIHDEHEAACARAEAETRLRESEKLHRFTLELTRQIVWSVEPDGSGLTLSPRYFEVTGMDPAEDPSLSIHPDDRERMAAESQAAMASGQPYMSECRLRMRDGSYRTFRVRSAPLRDADGRIIRWYGVSEDVHDELQASQAQREAEQRYRLAVRATSEAGWAYDVENDVLDCSDNSGEVFGAPDKNVGKTRLEWWQDRLHPDDQERIHQSFRNAMAGTQTHWSASYRFRRVNGEFADILD